MRDVELLEAIAAPNDEAFVYAYKAYFRQGATRIAWAYSPFGHELYVETAEGKIYCLDVKRPAP